MPVFRRVIMSMVTCFVVLTTLTLPSVVQAAQGEYVLDEAGVLSGGGRRECEAKARSLVEVYDTSVFLLLTEEDDAVARCKTETLETCCHEHGLSLDKEDDVLLIAASTKNAYVECIMSANHIDNAKSSTTGSMDALNQAVRQALANDDWDAFSRTCYQEAHEVLERQRKAELDAAKSPHVKDGFQGKWYHALGAIIFLLYVVLSFVRLVTVDNRLASESRTSWDADRYVIGQGLQLNSCSDEFVRTKVHKTSKD